MSKFLEDYAQTAAANDKNQEEKKLKKDEEEKLEAQFYIGRHTNIKVNNHNRSMNVSDTSLLNTTMMDDQSLI